MKRKIAIVLSFLLLFSTVIPFTYGFQNNQFYEETSDDTQSGKDAGSNDIPYQDGWPQETKGKIYSSPVIADLDKDGTMEIIVGSGAISGWDFNMYVFHSDGTLMDGWPIKVNRGIQGSPAVGDIDNDGDLEIVIADDGDAAYAWHHDGTPVEGWPLSIGYCISAPTLYDLDEDGDLEIIITGGEHIDSKTCAAVYIWHHDGTPFAGWPQIITEYSFSIIEYSSAAVGDIDDDDDAEIVVGIRTENYGQPSPGYVYAWHHTGQLMDGWPVPTGTYGAIHASPVLGDLDNDQDLEIIIGAYNGNVMVLHHDGTYVDGWPIDVSSWLHGQGVADIDQDGTLDIITGSHAYGYVFAWRYDGTALPGWPKNTNGRNLGPPILVDIIGDAHLEVLITSSDGKLHAWQHDGTQVPGFPLNAGGDGGGTTPCISDIDGDGDVELIVGSRDRNMYVWDLPAAYREEGMEWPMYQHDLYHTGCFGFGKGFTVDANGPYYGRIGREIEFVSSQVNGEPPFSWYWDFGDGNTSTERNPTHTYDSIVKDYEVNLTVTGSLGNKAYDVDHVEVSTYGRVEYGALKITSIFGGIGLSAIVENRGIVDARDVEWTMTVDESHSYDEGAILIPADGITSGTVDIPAGKTSQIWCPILENVFFRPWVNLDVTLTVQIEDCIDTKFSKRGASFIFGI